MATVHQLLDPGGKRLVRLAVEPRDGSRLIALGDLSDMIKIPLWTKVMRSTVANTPMIHRQRYIHAVTLRKWVRELSDRDHKKAAIELDEFAGWLETIVL